MMTLTHFVCSTANQVTLVQQRNKIQRRSLRISRKTDWQVGMHLRQRAVKSDWCKNVKIIKSAFQSWHAAAVVPESAGWVRSPSLDWRWRFMIIVLMFDRYDRFSEFMLRKFSTRSAGKGGIDARVEFEKCAINRTASESGLQWVYANQFIFESFGLFIQFHKWVHTYANASIH